MKYQRGQALVLVLLSLAVVLTIVLFILSRSITDVAVSSRSEEAVRAFSAAEAGVENALVVGTSSGLTTIGNATFNANVSNVSEGSNNFNYPVPINSGEATTLWFVAHDEANNDSLICNAQKPCFTGKQLKICWGNTGTGGSSSTTPAVELSVFYETTPGDPATTRIARAVYDPNSGRLASNSFSSPDGGTCTIGDVSYAFQKTIDLSTLGVPAGSYGSQNGLQFARVRMFYNTDTSHAVGFDVNFAGNLLLPSQGSQIDSTGTAGQSNRRISVFQGWPEAPAIFEGAVFSSFGLVK